MRLIHTVAVVYGIGILVDLGLEAKAFGFDFTAMRGASPNPFWRSLAWPVNIITDLKAAAA
jgi:hypothetical protein